MRQRGKGFCARWTGAGAGRWSSDPGSLLSAGASGLRQQRFARDTRQLSLLRLPTSQPTNPSPLAHRETQQPTTTPGTPSGPSRRSSQIRRSRRPSSHRTSDTKATQVSERKETQRVLSHFLNIEGKKKKPLCPPVATAAAAAAAAASATAATLSSVFTLSSSAFLSSL